MAFAVSLFANSLFRNRRLETPPTVWTLDVGLFQNSSLDGPSVPRYVPIESGLLGTDGLELTDYPE